MMVMNGVIANDFNRIVLDSRVFKLLLAIVTLENSGRIQMLNYFNHTAYLDNIVAEVRVVFS